MPPSLLRILLPLALVGLMPLPLRGADPEPRPFAVIDLHADVPYQVVYRGRPFDRGSGQYLASQFVRAGVMGVVLPLYVPHDVSPDGPRAEDLEQAYAQVFDGLARSAAYQLPGCRPGAVGTQTWLAFEGAAPLADQPDRLIRWVARGLRLLGLVHAHDNALATSSGMQVQPRRATVGLTARGRELVERAQAAGVLVDVSHASDAATDEIVSLAAAAGARVVASHSNARAIHRHARNLTDAQVRAIAATGGVVGVNFHSAYLVGGRPARLDDVVRHVRHLVRLVGASHVAIGSDFEGGIRPPPELSDVTGFQRLAAALQTAGLTRDEVELVMSGNALRLLCSGANPASRAP